MITKLIPDYVKDKIYYLKNIKINKDKIADFESKGEKIWLLSTSVHPNLGDQAITYAEIEFLKTYSNRKIIEITVSEFYSYLKYIKLYIKNNDIIVIHGGGNLGNQYLFCENQRRCIIKNFPNNRIMSFPQTIFFTDNKVGEKELKKSIEIYNNHRYLTLMAREKISLDLMNKYFYKNKVIYTPDIVMTLKPQCINVQRKGILLCMRDDVERYIESTSIDEIINYCKLRNYDTDITDTCIGNLFKLDERQIAINEKLQQFKSSKLIITDRIHGMIFAAITETPCIALSNYNHKVKGAYEWYKNLSFIKFIDDKSKIMNSIEELINTENCIYNTKYYEEYFEEIKRII